MNALGQSLLISVLLCTQGLDHPALGTGKHQGCFHPFPTPCVSLACKEAPAATTVQSLPLLFARINPTGGLQMAHCHWARAAAVWARHRHRQCQAENTLSHPKGCQHLSGTLISGGGGIPKPSELSDTFRHLKALIQLTTLSFTPLTVLFWVDLLGWYYYYYSFFLGLPSAR